MVTGPDQVKPGTSEKIASLKSSLEEKRAHHQCVGEYVLHNSPQGHT